MKKKAELRFDVEMIFGDKGSQKKLISQIKKLKEGESIVVKINDGTTQMTKEKGELVLSKTSVTMTGMQMREYSKLLEQIRINHGK